MEGSSDLRERKRSEYSMKEVSRMTILFLWFLVEEEEEEEEIVSVTSFKLLQEGRGWAKRLNPERFPIQAKSKSGQFVGANDKADSLCSTFSEVAQVRRRVS